VGNYLSPALQLLYDRKTMAFWPGPGEEPFDLESLVAAAEEGIIEGQEVFFVSTHGRPNLNGKYDLALVRSGALVVPQLEHSVGHFPQAVERWELPYRVYQLEEGLGHLAYEAESLQYDVGAVVEDAEASWGEALHADGETEKGFLCYGPYDRLASGEYQVWFRLKASNVGTNETVIAVLDVAADEGQTPLARRRLRVKDFGAGGTYRQFRVDFRNPRAQPLEFRTYFTGQAELWLDRVEVLRQ
jgi:hypothetical protein